MTATRFLKALGIYIAGFASGICATYFVAWLMFAGWGH